MNFAPGGWSDDSRAAFRGNNPPNGAPPYMYPYWQPMMQQYHPNQPEIVPGNGLQPQVNPYYHIIPKHTPDQYMKFSGSGASQSSTPHISLAASIVSTLSSERYKLFLTVFDIHNEMNSIGNITDKFNVDTFFMNFLNDADLIAVQKNVIPIIFNVLELLQKGTNEQLLFLTRPKIPVVFNYLRFRSGEEYCPVLKMLRNNIFTHFLYSFDLDSLEKGLFGECDLADIQIIGKIVTFPGCSQSVCAKVIVNTNEIHPVNFAENDFYYVLEKGRNIQQKIQVSVSIDQISLIWFAVMAVIPKQNTAEYLSAQQGCTTNFGIALSCGCSKKGKPAYDITNIIKSTVQNGFAMCPYCKSSILLSDLSFLPSKLNTAAPALKRSGRNTATTKEPKRTSKKKKQQSDDSSSQSNTSAPVMVDLGTDGDPSTDERIQNDESYTKMLMYVYKSAFREKRIKWKSLYSSANQFVAAAESIQPQESEPLPEYQFPDLEDDFMFEFFND